jgi:hypothetical protein
MFVALLRRMTPTRTAKFIWLLAFVVFGIAALKLAAFLGVLTLAPFSSFLTILMFSLLGFGVLVLFISKRSRP